MSVRIELESQHIEVHKYYWGAVAGVCFLALVTQAFLNRLIPQFQFLELPFLVVVYFGMSRRNTVPGMTLGLLVGLLQDGLSQTPIGLYGIAKSIIGYLAASVGARLDTEHPVSRFILTFLLFEIHQAVLAITIRLLLARSTPFVNLHLLAAALVNSVLGVFLFAGLDRLRKN